LIRGESTQERNREPSSLAINNNAASVEILG